MPRVTFDLPPDELRPNYRMGKDYRAVRRIERQYHADCVVIAGRQRAEWEGLVIATWPIRLDLTAYLGKGQRCDTWDVGAWAKAAGDALVEVRALPDDNASRINPVVTHVARDWERPRLVFEWATSEQGPVNELAWPMVLLRRTVRQKGREIA